MRLARYAHGKINELRLSPILTEIPIVILTKILTFSYRLSKSPSSDFIVIL